MKGSPNSTMRDGFIDDSILMQGMQVQLSKWKTKLELGHKRVGWKIGFNAKADQNRMKIESPIVGFLTNESVIESGSTYKGSKDSKLMVEAEVAILIGEDVEANSSNEVLIKSIKGFAPAIEIVDFARTSHDMTSILEDNIFHETVIFGDINSNISNFTVKEILANVSVNGVDIESGDHSRYPDDICEVILCVANTLAKQNERLLSGDWIIAGSLTKPVEVNSGDKVVISLSPLGSLLVNIMK